MNWLKYSHFKIKINLAKIIFKKVKKKQIGVANSKTWEDQIQLPFHLVGDRIQPPSAQGWLTQPIDYK